MDSYPSKYKVPNILQDYNGLIYSKGEIEGLIEPNQLPNELSNNISLSDYKDIINRCNYHIERIVYHRKTISFCSIGICLSFVFCLFLSILYFKKISLVIVSSIVFFISFILLIIYIKKFNIKMEDNFNKTIEYLNYTYNSNGIKVVKRYEVSKPTGWRLFIFKSIYLVRIYINYQVQQTPTTTITPQLYNTHNQQQQQQSSSSSKDINERTPLI